MWVFILHWLLNNVCLWLCGNCHLNFLLVQLIRTSVRYLGPVGGKSYVMQYNQYFLFWRKHKLGLLKNYLSSSKCWRTSFWHKLFGETTKEVVQVTSSFIREFIKYQEISSALDETSPEMMWDSEDLFVLSSLSFEGFELVRNVLTSQLYYLGDYQRPNSSYRDMTLPLAGMRRRRCNRKRETGRPPC